MNQTPVAIRICYLYPRLLSVAGDRGNLFALVQRCDWRGIRYSVTEADVGEVPDLAQADLILLHGGQDREMTAAASDLAAKAGPLREASEAPDTSCWAGITSHRPGRRSRASGCWMW
jgi:lipid II isoglutaminyl synthase (glutamine-hydrolysing)